jgi:uncharacterized membrane protein
MLEGCADGFRNFSQSFQVNVGILTQISLQLQFFIFHFCYSMLYVSAPYLNVK